MSSTDFNDSRSLFRRCRHTFLEEAELKDLPSLEKIARKRGGNDNEVAVFAPNMLAHKSGKGFKCQIIILHAGEAGGSLTEGQARKVEAIRERIEAL